MRRLVASSAALLTAPAFAGGVVFVDDDADPGGDGTGWATAYRYLQDALAEAADPVFAVAEVRVAGGVYTPDRDEAGDVTPGDRDASFHLVNGVAIRGGYLGLSAGKTGDPNERDVVRYGTVLTGDLLGNDAPPVGTLSDNSFHVVTGSVTDATAALDGFTVTAGFASSAPTGDDRGGGMLNADGGEPMVLDCSFVGNLATGGGGAVCNVGGADPTFIGCAFIDNGITGLGAANGGAILAEAGGTTPLYIDCTFTGNDVGVIGGVGGAIRSSGGSPTWTNCTFIGNTSSSGGAISASGDPTWIDCTFIGNTAETGGAVRVSPQSEFVRCTFIDNSVMDEGGGVFAVGISSQFHVFTNCLFVGNSAETGGAVEAAGPSVVITNCTITDNTALFGGAVEGTGIYTYRNSILWGNTPGQIATVDNTVSYCDVQGGWAGTGNIDADPLFVDPGGGDLHLSPGSPCIDAGHSLLLLPGNDTDLDGNPRFADDGCTLDTGIPGIETPVVDLGVYEFQRSSCDLDGDGVVGILDFLLLLAEWGPCPAPCPPSCLADVDGDCVVGILDFLLLLGDWG